MFDLKTNQWEQLNLKGYPSPRSGHRMVIAESLSEEEIAGLREMFQAIDTDNSGAITFDELKAGLRRYGSTLKHIEIRDLMEATNNNVKDSMQNPGAQPKEKHRHVFWLIVG